MRRDGALMMRGEELVSVTHLEIYATAAMSACGGA